MSPPRTSGRRAHGGAWAREPSLSFLDQGQRQVPVTSVWGELLGDSRGGREAPRAAGAPGSGATLRGQGWTRPRAPAGPRGLPGSTRAACRALRAVPSPREATTGSICPSAGSVWPFWGGGTDVENTGSACAQGLTRGPGPAPSARRPCPCTPPS